MLINAYAEPHRVVTYPGTRLLQDSMGILGAEVHDPRDGFRRWVVQAVYAPIPSRRLGGIRAKLEDSKGFITFCNQRDLEVLLQLAVPDTWCRWAQMPYADHEDEQWFGLCADEDDLFDDLLEREMILRNQTPGGVLAPPMEILRRVHLEPKYDVEEFYVLLGDFDPETGYFPDGRLETIERRWIRSHRERVRWDRI